MKDGEHSLLFGILVGLGNQYAFEVQKVHVAFNTPSTLLPKTSQEQLAALDYLISNIELTWAGFVQQAIKLDNFITTKLIKKTQQNKKEEEDASSLLEEVLFTDENLSDCLTVDSTLSFAS